MTPQEIVQMYNNNAIKSKIDIRLIFQPELSNDKYWRFIYETIPEIGVQTLGFYEVIHLDSGRFDTRTKIGPACDVGMWLHCHPAGFVEFLSYQECDPDKQEFKARDEEPLREWIKGTDFFGPAFLKLNNLTLDEIIDLHKKKEQMILSYSHNI